jgi:GH24 family phage-related lysozyme (muramidase)
MQPKAQTGGMHINPAGVAIIKSSEGVHLTAYNSAGQWLIGYGHAKGVKAGMTISAAQAEAYLKEDLAMCEDAVSDAVQAPITRNQFSAMVSLCYNIGTGGFKSSSLVKHLNAGEEQAAADAFLDWSKAKIKGQRTVLAHLLERRQKERALFLDGMGAPRA